MPNLVHISNIIITLPSQVVTISSLERKREEQIPRPFYPPSVHHRAMNHQDLDQTPLSISSIESEGLFSCSSFDICERNLGIEVHDACLDML